MGSKSVGVDSAGIKTLLGENDFIVKCRVFLLVPNDEQYLLFHIIWFLSGFLIRHFFVLNLNTSLVKDSLVSLAGGDASIRLV